VKRVVSDRFSVVSLRRREVKRKDNAEKQRGRKDKRWGSVGDYGLPPGWIEGLHRLKPVPLTHGT
jgi:hypothetical protein